MRQTGIALIALALLVAITAGCGGSDGEATANASAEFLNPKGKSKIAKFGKEADEDEREAASEILEESLDARAAADFKAQCATLSKPAAKSVIEGLSILYKKNTCPKSLRGQAEPLPSTSELRANNMTGPIDAFRVKGDRGYALYHGTKGNDYSMLMEKEDGEWKVGDVLTKEIP